MATSAEAWGYFPRGSEGANELAAEGLVEFIDNPKHRSSKLVRLTRKGEARYRELNAQLISIAWTMGVALNEADVARPSRSCGD